MVILGGNDDEIKVDGRLVTAAEGILGVLQQHFAVGKGYDLMGVFILKG